MSSNKKRRTPIICCGISVVLCMSVLSGLTVNSVLNKVNRNADEAYAEAVKLAKHQSYVNQQELDALAKLDKISMLDANVDGIIKIDDKWYLISSTAGSSNDTKLTPLDKVEIEEPSNKEPDASTDAQGLKPDTEGEEKVDSEINTTPPDSVPEGTEEKPKKENADTGVRNDTTSTIEDDEVVEHPYIGAKYVVIDVDGTLVYLVKKGDTLSKISGLVGYSVQELAEYNHIQNVNLIYVDQAIRIPAGQKAIDSVRKYQAEHGIN